MAIAEAGSFLAAAIGLDPEAVGPRAVSDAVRVRMAACGAATASEYAARLKAQSAERQALIEAVVVPETWFFRDREPFEFLTHAVAGEWRPNHPGACLRVLSLPCSTGEEPYSIAIALRRAGLGAGDYLLDAVDISRACLRTAQAGIYGRRAFREPLPADWALYADEAAGGWAVQPGLRAGIRFRQGNLLTFCRAPDEAGYDVVFCRNLLIYQHEAARRRAAGILDDCLAAGGWLFVGHAEMMPLLSDRFAPVRHAGAFAYRKRAEPRPAPAAAPAAKQAAMAAPPAPARQPDRLAQARALADQGRLAEAAAACEALLADARADPDVYFLLGVVRAAAGDTAGAEFALGRAVYLDADHAGALGHLALLTAERGEIEAAERLSRRADRARAASGARRPGETQAIP